MPFTIKDDFLSWDNFIEVVQALDMRSSPGYPYMRNYPTNRHLFMTDDQLDDRKCKMVYQEVLNRIQTQPPADPIKVFIKPEPISIKKYDEGRFRLISSVSIVDQIIDHLLFDEMNEKFYSNWVKTPVKVGWSPIKGGWRFVPMIGVRATDKSAWDWTVQEWLVDIIWQYRLNMSTAPQQWRDLVNYRYNQLFREARFIFSNGFIIKQKFSGMMKSGCVNTIIDNSLMQIVLDILVRRRTGLPSNFLWAMGDDVLQGHQPQEYFDELSKLCILKHVDEKAEFAGMVFSGSVVDPSYPQKHAFNLLHAKDSVLPDLAKAYPLLYARSAEGKEILEALSQVERLLPKSKALGIYDGFL